MVSVISHPINNFFLVDRAGETRHSAETHFKQSFSDRPLIAGKHPGINFFRCSGVEFAISTPARNVQSLRGEPQVLEGTRYHDGIDQFGNRYFVKKTGSRPDKYGDSAAFVSYETDGPLAINSPIAPPICVKYSTKLTSNHTAVFVPLKEGDLADICYADHEISKRARSAYAAMRQLCTEAHNFHIKTHQAHLDIRPQNVFHDGQSVMLGDFGGAAHFEHGSVEDMHRVAATRKTLVYSPPELSPKGTTVVGPGMLKIDSWGIALVCLSILGYNPLHLGLLDITDQTNPERRLFELETAAMLSYLEFEEIRLHRYATHVTLSAEVASRLSCDVGQQVPITEYRATRWREMWKTAEDHLDLGLLKCIHGMLDADPEKRDGVEKGAALPPRNQDTDFIWTGARTTDDTREERFAQLKQDLETVSRLWPYKPPQRRSVKSTVPAGVGVGLLSTFTVQTLSYILPMVSFAAGWWIFWVAAPVAGIMVGVLVCRQLWVWGELSDEVKAEIEANRPRHAAAAPAVNA